MFTIEQIHQAHNKVRSGADFPAYIRDLKKLGVTAYKTWVKDGHTDFDGAGYQVSSRPKYEDLAIADTSNKEVFIQDLKIHQQGGSDYFTFIRQCAGSGIHHWLVSIDNMTCTYFDKAGREILIEEIP